MREGIVLITGHCFPAAGMLVGYAKRSTGISQALSDSSEANATRPETDRGAGRNRRAEMKIKASGKLILITERSACSVSSA